MHNRIEDLAKKACDDLKLHLVEVKIRGDRHKPVFEVFADGDTGITLGECENLTRALQDYLDMDESISGDYRLNVSSPGLDRPLIHNFEFKKNIGQLIIVKLLLADGIKEITGKLTGFDDNILELELKNKIQKINRSEIETAKVKIRW